MKSSEKIRERLNALIKRGDEIQATLRIVNDTGGKVLYSKNRYEWDRRQYASWITSCVAAADALGLVEGPLKQRTDLLGKGDVTPEIVEAKIGILMSLVENIDQGLLRKIEDEIGAEVSFDFMGQAEALLNEDGNLQHGYVPAAVLSGAVLERALRTICDQESPPIATIKANGDFKSMDALINDLDQARRVNSNCSKQLRAWAGVRNSAAHGRVEEFNKAEVARMITGVKDFISEHLQIL